MNGASPDREPARRPLGRTGLRVFPVGLGTMQFGWTVSDVAAMRLLDQYLDLGGNLVDTANMYGGDQSLESFAENRGHVGVSEDLIGRWLASRNRRDDVVLTTKVRARMWDGPDGEGLTRAHIVRAVEDSLRRLRTDAVDVLYAHWPDPGADDTEWLATFQELIDAGKVRHAGSSNFCDFAGGGDLLTPLLEIARSEPRCARIACEQPRYNLVNRREYEDRLQSIALSEGLGIVTYSSLASGFLAGDQPGPDGPCGGRSRQLAKYDNPAGRALRRELISIAADHRGSISAVSLAWTLAQPGITATLVGAETPSQLRDATRAAELTLEADALARLSEVSLAESTPEFVQW